MLVVFWLAIVIAGVIVGALRINVLVLLVPAVITAAAVSLTFQIDPLVRWRADRYLSGFIGPDEIVEVRPSGITFKQGEMTSNLPWTSFTGIKANEKAVVFLKGRAPFGIIPASAFQDSKSRDENSSRWRGAESRSPTALRPEWTPSGVDRVRRSVEYGWAGGITEVPRTLGRTFVSSPVPERFGSVRQNPATAGARAVGLDLQDFRAGAVVIAAR
jgi:hypothetical protein